MSDETIAFADRLFGMRVGYLHALSLACCLPGCASTPQVAPASPSPRTSPYIAVQKPVPDNQNRIYLLAGIPGRIVIAQQCVLFERLDGSIVLPVFEHGVVAGQDQRGSWIYDPYSKRYFRHRARVAAGGGGSGETIAGLEERNVLQHPVPKRCVSAVTKDVALMLNPGLKKANVDE